MRVFVSEFVCGGSWPEESLDRSLVREGQAMLLAIAADLADVAEARVVTTWDARLGPFPISGIEARMVDRNDDEEQVFRDLAAQCDATFVIAPELDDILIARRRMISEAGGHDLGASLEATSLCTDKLATFERLRDADIAAVETAPIRPGTAEHIGSTRWKSAVFRSSCRVERQTQVGTVRDIFQPPLVIKRRDGAGSQDMRLIRDRQEWDEFVSRQPWGALPSCQPRPLVQQPWISGMAVSVGCLISGHPPCVDLFPPGQQILSSDGRFRYLGGRIPAPLSAQVRAAVLKTVERACAAIDGLSGFIGFDLIVPDTEPERPQIVDINPRLTTSYVGYRRLTRTNLAERLLSEQSPKPPIVWDTGTVAFDVAALVLDAPTASDSQRDTSVEP